MTVPVLLGARGSIELDLLQILANEPGFSVRERCSSGSELLAATRAGLGRLAVITADFCTLDLDYLTALLSAGSGVILVLAREGNAALARVAAEMGVWIANDADQVSELLREWLAHEDAKQPVIEDAGARDDGTVVAVWGPAGAPGRTRLAIEISHHLAQFGSCVLLIDADPYGGAIAAALGLLDESSGLIAATRAAGIGELDTDELLQFAVALQPNLRLLAGIPRADRWPELTPTALEHLWRVARSAADMIVIDCGFSLETDEEIMFDTHAPRRNGATLSALATADSVVVVGQADPVQMPRLVRGLGELREHINVAEHGLEVVVTRIRSTVAGRGADASVQEILQRYAGIPRAHMIPEERETFDKALLSGKSVLEISAKSPATVALSDLAKSLLTVSKGA